MGLIAWQDYASWPYLKTALQCDSNAVLERTLRPHPCKANIQMDKGLCYFRANPREDNTASQQPCALGSIDQCCGNCGVNESFPILPPSETIRRTRSTYTSSICTDLVVYYPCST